ncbi:MAG TPA: hypothetical protein VHW71_04280 [Steroidobacteraceae bacterium]|jgi:hypothetical protein|nr:hypothetical protein [Steroidobacteraceae bacterium]
MTRITISVAIISAAVLLSGAAQAMEIRQFDKMAVSDQAEYIADLIQGAEDVLNDAAQRDQSEKLRHLFIDIAQGDQISLGMAELNVNLAGVRAAEVSRQARDAKLRHLDVEDTFKATAEDHGIKLSDAVFSVNSKFRPKLPPKQ